MYNTGQTAVFLKDLTGREYPAIAVVNRKRRVNGQRELTLSFLYIEINSDFMDKIEFGWQVLFGGEWYSTPLHIPVMQQMEQLWSNTSRKWSNFILKLK